MRRAAILLTWLAAACSTSTASAATGTFEVARLVGSTVPDETLPALAGPVPAGELTAFAVRRADGDWALRLAGPAVAASDVPSIGPQSPALELLASPTRLVASRARFNCGDCGRGDYVRIAAEVLTGPLGGPLATLAHCALGGPCSELACRAGVGYDLALSGDLLALRDPCAARVFDLSTGARRELGAVDEFAVAGRLVAFVPRPVAGSGRWRTFVVAAAASGTELYRSEPNRGEPDPSSFPPPGPTLLSERRIALTADGTLAFLGSRNDLMLATPQLPDGRAVRRLPGGTRIIAAGAAGVLLWREVTRRLELVAPDGRTLLARDLEAVLGTPASDGDAVVWAQRTCATTAITSWRFGDPEPARPDLRCATPRPSRAARTLSRTRRLRIPLSCSATPRGGCLATVTLTGIRGARRPPGAHGASRLYRLGSARVALDPGETARAVVPVSLRAARWLGRHSRLRLRIDVVADRRSLRPVGEIRLPSADGGFVRRTVRLRVAR